MLSPSIFEPAFSALLVFLAVCVCSAVVTLVARVRYLPHQTEFSPLSAEQREAGKQTYLAVRRVGWVAAAVAALYFMGTCAGN